MVRQHHGNRDMYAFPHITSGIRVHFVCMSTWRDPSVSSGAVVGTRVACFTWRPHSEAASPSGTAWPPGAGRCRWHEAASRCFFKQEEYWGCAGLVVCWLFLLLKCAMIKAVYCQHPRKTDKSTRLLMLTTDQDLWHSTAKDFD